MKIQPEANRIRLHRVRGRIFIRFSCHLILSLHRPRLLPTKSLFHFLFIRFHSPSVVLFVLRLVFSFASSYIFTLALKDGKRSCNYFNQAEEKCGKMKHKDREMQC